MRNLIHFEPASQIDNLGDQLINSATIGALRPFGDIVVNDLRTPAWFIEAIGAGGDRRASELFKRHFYVGLAARLIRNGFARRRVRHYLVLAPGHSSRKGYGEALAAFKWYAKLVVLRMLGCKVVRAGFSIGPFDRPNAWVESFGARGFAYYGVRDRVSLELARRSGISKARYFPDLAWAGSPSGAGRTLSENPPVVLSFRSNAFGKVHDPRYLQPLRERLRRLATSSSLAGRPFVVCYQVQSDEHASREIFEDLQKNGVTVEFRESILTLEAALELYGRAFCVVSNRLHVLLLSVQAGTLPIALADGTDNGKITSILNDNGFGNLVVDPRTEAEASDARVESILRGREETLARLSRSREENAERIREGFAGIFRPADRLAPGDSRHKGGRSQEDDPRDEHRKFYRDVV